MNGDMKAMDEFDVLLNDVLRKVANPEVPDRTRVYVQTRVWVREMGIPTSGQNGPDMGHPHADLRSDLHANLDPRAAVVLAPEVFLDFERRMHPKRDAKSTTAAMLLHAAAFALLFWGVSNHVHTVNLEKQLELSKLVAPPPMAPLKDTMGGGGGQRGPAPVSNGQLPKFAATQITPPKAPPMDQPKIRMPDPTIEVQTNLKMANNSMPNLGMPNSPMIGNSLGNGTGTGIGSGGGAGFGPGSGGDYGGGLRKIGGGVSSPVVIYRVEPEFSEEARKAKFMGNVLVNLIVDAKGMPQNVHVLRGVGMGLDDKALAAVKQYRFRPAMEGGKPVPVELNVEVDFQIF